MYEEKLYECNNRKYFVSNDGHVYIADRKTKYHKEVKQRLTKDGYLEVTLGETTHRTSRKVHRLVAELFIKNHKM